MLETPRQFTERDLATFIRRRAKQLGASGMAFPPIVAFGSGSSEIHHFATPKKIGKNSFLMLDFGVKVRGYCSDFTRTLFLGRPQKIHENIYNIVLHSQLLGIKAVRAGRGSDEVDFAARHAINSTGLGRYFTHGTGHGVGRQIHEKPSFKTNTHDILVPSDIVTIEPGIYLPGRFGVRIEDMVLVKNKPQVFSRVPKDFKSMVISK